MAYGSSAYATHPYGAGAVIAPTEQRETWPALVSMAVLTARIAPGTLPAQVAAAPLPAAVTSSVHDAMRRRVPE